MAAGDGGSTIAATLAFNGAFFVTLMLLFEYYRCKVVDVYAPRSRGKQPKSDQPREGFGQWFFQIYAVGDDEMFRIAGMDGYVFLRFIKFCCKVCTITSLLAVSVLMPVYYTGEEGKDGMDLASMANIEAGGTRLWASFVAAYLFSGIFLYLIHLEYGNFVSARQRYFDGQDDVTPAQMHYTVQIENIPTEYRSSEKLMELFNSIFPHEVHFAHVAVSTPALDSVIHKRNVARNQLERAIASYEASQRRHRPTLMLRRIKSSLLNSDKEVDALIYLTGRLDRLAVRVARLQEECQRDPEQAHLHEDRKVWAPLSLAPPRDLESDVEVSEAGSRSSSFADRRGLLDNTTAFFHDANAGVRNFITANFISATGFVTFKTRRSQVSAVRMPILLDWYPRMTALPAPAPNDVIWCNMSASLRHTEDVAYVSAVGYYAGLLFWSVVMASVAAMGNVSNLEKYLPFLRHMPSLAYAFLQGILPVVVVMCFSMLMASTIAFVARDIEKRKTQSAVELEVFKWYFMYQITNIYLLLFAGSIWDSLSEAIENPKAIVSLISAALPSVSIFFINFIITSWLSGVPYKLIRRYHALEYLYYCVRFGSASLARRTLKEGPFAEARVSYGTELSDVLYVLCVVLLYWIIAPVVLLLATALFWSWYYSWKYHYYFVVTRTFDSGGQFWYKIYRFSMTGLMAGSITFMAYMGIKEGIAQGPLLLPLPLLILFCWRFTEKRFREKSKNLAFGSALMKKKPLTAVTAYTTAPATAPTTTSTASTATPTTSPSPVSSIVDSFSATFMVQPNLLAPPRIYPYPYRIDSIPLLDSYGSFTAVYVEDLPEGADPTSLFPNTAFPDYTLTKPQGKEDPDDDIRTVAAAQLHAPLTLDGVEQQYCAETENLLARR